MMQPRFEQFPNTFTGMLEELAQWGQAKRVERDRWWAKKLKKLGLPVDKNVRLLHGTGDVLDGKTGRPLTKGKGKPVRLSEAEIDELNAIPGPDTVQRHERFVIEAASGAAQAAEIVNKAVTAQVESLRAEVAEQIGALRTELTTDKVDPESNELDASEAGTVEMGATGSPNVTREEAEKPEPVEDSGPVLADTEDTDPPGPPDYPRPSIREVG